MTITHRSMGGVKMLGLSYREKGIRGFSLLEVILAMVVIGLLATLLVPVVRTAEQGFCIPHEGALSV